jgi:site-specific recombinase
MSEICMANCMAKPIHLQLRNKTFYYRVELPRVNDKRRYKIISLHTQNYFEAKERIKQMVALEEDFAQLQRLFNNLIFENVDNTGNAGLISRFPSRKLSKRNKVEDITQIYNLYNKLSEDVKNLTQEKQSLLNEISSLKDVIKEFIGPLNTMMAELHKPAQTNSVPITTSYTISKVMESMLLLKQAKNSAIYQTRKKQALVKMIEDAGLSLDDDYAKFHDVAMIEALSKKIINDTSMMNDNKKMKIRYLKELATHGSNLNPDLYKVNILNNFPEIEGTKKADKNPHLPYRKEQLLEIFNPKHDYFKKKPDAFWACVIALFTGARINAAITLQYKDVLVKDGINCIQFLSDHPIKQLKNDASERLVPIHEQLLDLGFVDYINKQKTKSKASDTDFIIKKCQTKSGQYNNKFFTRELSPFLMDIKVKTGNNDGYDFHSFRKNISIAMQDAGIGATYINDVIGWEGKDTMEQSYSNHTLEQIKNEMSKFSYDFLEPHFKKWRKILKS